MKSPGYCVTLNGVHDGRERWSAYCACGWWDHRRITRDTALNALREHWQTCRMVKQ